MATADQTPCIVGIGASSFAALHAAPDPQRSAYALAADAFYAALDDAGLAKDAVDSVVVGRLPSYLKFCADVGLHDIGYVNFQSGGGNQSGLALLQAAMLVRTGQAQTVACVYGNNGRSVRARYGGAALATSRYDDPYGMTSFGAHYGMQFRRHKHLYGTPDAVLAELAMSNRANAGRNPDAVMRTPMTREDYRASPFVADPLRLLDYCMINDGGVAYLVTSLARARDLRAVPVRVLSSASTGAMGYHYSPDDGWYGCLGRLRERLFGAAGIAPADIRVAQLYDNFTPAMLFALEGIGICERGGGGAWVMAGNHRRGGALPLNTAGGHLSEAYMQGWALTVEAVRQMRGEAGIRQVPDCDLSLEVTCSPICTAHVLSL